MESEVQGFNNHWSNILLLGLLFSHSKASDANIGIIAYFGSFENLYCTSSYSFLPDLNLVNNLILSTNYLPLLKLFNGIIYRKLSIYLPQSSSIHCFFARDSDIQMKAIVPIVSLSKVPLLWYHHLLTEVESCLSQQRQGICGNCESKKYCEFLQAMCIACKTKRNTWTMDCLI